MSQTKIKFRVVKDGNPSAPLTKTVERQVAAPVAVAPHPSVVAYEAKMASIEEAVELAAYGLTGPRRDAALSILEGAIPSNWTETLKALEADEALVRARREEEQAEQASLRKGEFEEKMFLLGLDLALAGAKVDRDLADVGRSVKNAPHFPIDKGKKKTRRGKRGGKKKN